MKKGMFIALGVLILAAAIYMGSRLLQRPPIYSTRRSYVAHTYTGSPHITIYYDNYGFDPNELTVPVGSHVAVKNISSQEMLTFNSIPNQPNAILDLGQIAKNQSKAFIMSRAGVWQFEANNQPEIRGEIGTGRLSITPAIYPDARIHNNPVSISYDDYGFMPNEVSVPVGTTVTLTNNSTNTQPGPSLFQEGPGSTAANPALNIGSLQKQRSKSFTLNTRGTWILENAYQPAGKNLAQITSY